MLYLIIALVLFLFSIEIACTYAERYSPLKPREIVTLVLMVFCTLSFFLVSLVAIFLRGV